MKQFKDLLLSFFKRKFTIPSRMDREMQNGHKKIDNGDPIPQITNTVFIASQQQLNELSAIWKGLGSLSETLNINLDLWHSGTIGSHDMIDNSIILWFTRDANRTDFYKESARLDAPHMGKNPYLIHFRTNRILNMADFNGKSLRPFTISYCNQEHRVLKKVLREWCLKNGFDGAVRTNGGMDEVVLVKPKEDLLECQITSL